MPILNSTKSIYLEVFFEPSALINMDTKLVGAEGGVRVIISTPFSQIFFVQQTNIIAHLELLAFMVALKAWPYLVSNTKFVACLNNMVAVLAIPKTHLSMQALGK